MTTIKIMTLPQQAMDVAISVAADVLHLWPSLDGYDAMVGVSDVIPDSQIMIQVPEYNTIVIIMWLRPCSFKQ